MFRACSGGKRQRWHSSKAVQPSLPVGGPARIRPAMRRLQCKACRAASGFPAGRLPAVRAGRRSQGAEFVIRHDRRAVCRVFGYRHAGIIGDRQPRHCRRNPARPQIFIQDCVKLSPKFPVENLWELTLMNPIGPAFSASSRTRQVNKTPPPERSVNRRAGVCREMISAA
jgi:hypothetical protein